MKQYKDSLQNINTGIKLKTVLLTDKQLNIISFELENILDALVGKKFKKNNIDNERIYNLKLVLNDLKYAEL